MSTREKLMTVAEFEHFVDLPENSERRFELINGGLVEMSPSELHGLVGSSIHGEVYIFNKEHRLGRVMFEVLHRVPGDEHNALSPDIAFTSHARALPIVERGIVPHMPDLAVEIKSPGNTYLELRAKAAYYLRNGARMVWLVFPHKRIIEVYTPDADVEILTESDTLTGGAVLPGFEIAVREVFDVE